MYIKLKLMQIARESKPYIISPPPDTRGIHASCSRPLVMQSAPCNLLVHSSSLPMERWSMVVPGSQRKVSMHGRVIGPKLMLVMQGTCCARDGSWAINPKGSSMLRLSCAVSHWSSKTCAKYGFSRHPFTLVLGKPPEASMSW